MDSDKSHTSSKKLVDGERMDDKSDEYLDRYGNVVDDDDDDDNSKSLHVPPLFSSRRVSSRKSIRSLSEDEYRYASVKSLFINFCARTSSHGIPFVGTSSFFGPWVWGAVFLCALMFFLFQTYWTMADYLQYRTIIEMQLRFEAAPFPAATVCNLNAFKYSELIQYEEIKQGFEYWERVINAREMREQMRQDNTASRKIDMRRKRSDRKLNLVFPIDEGELTGAEYQPVFVRCTCMNTEQCVPNRNPLEVNASVCMCFEDITKGLIWPCYPTTVWTVKKCTQCSISNTCADPDGPHATDVARSNDPIECLCQSISHHCMVHPKDEIKWWNPNNYTIYPVTEPPTMESVDTEEAYGLHDLKDAGAITTQTKENLIFLVAALPRDVRRNLSYALNEFVLQCSFNSKDCNMESDFKLHIDPEYGNCYTFNFNHSVELNTRAGPMYGLRLLLDVHQNDYMPTTEAAGVRIVVHEQDQEPFPDTFGYSAPTGFISSFGLKTKVLHRLDEPYGQCSDVFRPPVYIYDERYSPEGCHRNCFQLKVLEDCKCGDPRYPLPTKQDRHCSAKSLMDRQCLANLTNSQSGYRQVPLKCLRQCKQPCHENVFETAYSAAAWPSVNFKIGVECPAVVEIFNDTQACTEYYRINTAYIEIYYEQLNYETLKETAGYTLVNLFSDFGGNIGLWIGFSVITFLELLEFVCEMGYYVLYVKPIRLHRKLKRRRNHDAEELSTPRVVQHVLYSPRSMRLRERIDDMPPKE